MNIHVGKFVEKKKRIKEKWIVSKRPRKKMVLKKKRNRKEVEVQFELYCVKLVELMLLENKNCAPLVFRNYFVLYISFLHS